MSNEFKLTRDEALWLEFRVATLLECYEEDEGDFAMVSNLLKKIRKVIA